MHTWAEHMRRVDIVLLAATFACMGDLRPAHGRTPRMEVVVLGEAESAKLLQPCSRPTPQGLTGYWHPDPKLVARIEAPLAQEISRALARVVDRDMVKGISPTDYRVQYAGAYRGRRRVVYANGILTGTFFDQEFATRFNQDAERKGQTRRIHGEDWRSVAIRICDGGVVSFGLLYDVSAGRFSEFKFNGTLEGPLNVRAK
jgi:hypothetical protein